MTIETKSITAEQLSKIYFSTDQSIAETFDDFRRFGFSGVKSKDLLNKEQIVEQLSNLLTIAETISDEAEKTRVLGQISQTLKSLVTAQKQLAEDFSSELLNSLDSVQPSAGVKERMMILGCIGGTDSTPDEQINVVKERTDYLRDKLQSVESYGVDTDIVLGKLESYQAELIGRINSTIKKPVSIPGAEAIKNLIDKKKAKNAATAGDENNQSTIQDEVQKKSNDSTLRKGISNKAVVFWSAGAAVASSWVFSAIVPLSGVTALPIVLGIGAATFIGLKISQRMNNKI